MWRFPECGINMAELGCVGSKAEADCAGQLGVVLRQPLNHIHICSLTGTFPPRKVLFPIITLNPASTYTHAEDHKG